jgi:asparaginyl-tRNA synthetase
MSRLARLGCVSRVGIRRGCIARCVSGPAIGEGTAQTIRDVFSAYAKRASPHINEAVPATALPPPAHVAVIGWVRSARKQKNVTFLEVTDGTSPRTLQVIWSAADNEAVGGGDASLMDRLTVGASVCVEGNLVPSPKPAQPIELHASRVRVLGDCPVEPFPLQKKAHSQEFLREVMHLRPRTAGVASMLRLRSSLSLALHNFFAGEGYVHVATPILTSNDCEGAGEQFAVSAPRRLTSEAVAPHNGPVALETGKGGAAAASAAATAQPHPPANAADAAAASPHFFGKPVYLTVSGQLHLEAFACALSRVYTFGPTFRAENSNTSRHLAEFWMLEPELAPGSMDDAVGVGCREARQRMAPVFASEGGMRCVL